MAFVEGRKEGRFQGLEESVLIMEGMEEVRRQGGLREGSGKYWVRRFRWSVRVERGGMEGAVGRRVEIRA